MSGPSRLDDVYRVSAEIARRHCRMQLFVENLWVGLCHVDDTVVRKTMESQGIDIRQFRHHMLELAIAKAQTVKSKDRTEVEIAQACFSLMKRARTRANSDGRVHPLASDLFGEMIFGMDDAIAAALLDVGSNRDAMTNAYLTVTEQSPVSADGDDRAAGLDTGSFLCQFGRDYRQLAEEGRFGPTIGRSAEMLQLVQILSRKEKNNPVLVGEPGVGKTAIVEGLAVRSVGDSAPEVIRGKSIIELSLPALVAGTRYRGDMEDRLRNVLAEAQRNKDVILFIDEIHTMVGAGSAGDAMDMANIMKPALSRGELRLIGATTTAEYQRYIEKDPALERRFQMISVEEPTPDETMEILRGVRESYELHHHVRLTDEALQAAVDLTVRHVPERRLPDKARDVIDQAAAEARIRTLSKVDEEPAIIAIEADDIAATVAAWKKIPVEKVTLDARQRLKTLGDRLRERVVAQDEVVDSLVESVQTALLGLADPRKPHGVFLFAGPTGVGKTELAKALAEQLFQDDSALLKLDMTEYAEAHSVSRLIGSPPGYVGHEEKSLLVDEVRARPYQIILLDEIEKAHPKVIRLFLQVFDEGRLTDTKGRTADFRNTLIIMTSNIGAAEAMDDERGELGFHDARNSENRRNATILEAIHEAFSPEFIARLSAIHVFRPLSSAAIRKVAEKYVAALRTRLAAHQVNLDLTDDVYSFLVHQTMGARLGARPMERNVEMLLVAPVARLLLDRAPHDEAKHLAVVLEEGKIEFVWDDVDGSTTTREFTHD